MVENTRGMMEDKHSYNGTSVRDVIETYFDYGVFLRGINKTRMRIG